VIFPAFTPTEFWCCQQVLIGWPDNHTQLPREPMFWCWRVLPDIEIWTFQCFRRSLLCTTSMRHYVQSLQCVYCSSSVRQSSILN